MYFFGELYYRCAYEVRFEEAVHALLFLNASYGPAACMEEEIILCYSFLFLATHINTQSQYDSSSNIVVVRPFLLEYDYTVYTLPDAVISLRCLPNDTRAPILWRR